MSEERDSGLHAGSLIIGLALGVAATLVYATYQEKSFNRLVSRTREIGDQTGDFFGDLTDNVKDRAAQLTGRMRSMVDDVEETAHETVKAAKSAGKEAASHARKAIES